MSAQTPRETPAAAFMYDYFLGGDQATEVDVQAAENLIAIQPSIPRVARMNRKFLQDAVRWFAGRGHGQFLDVGSGLPTQDNVHQVARDVNPASRTVYVDFDPEAVARSRELLALERDSVGRVAVVEGDLREVETLLARVREQGVLDFSRPVVLLLVAVLHFIPGEPDVVGPKILQALAAELAPGSVLIMSHGSATKAYQARTAEVVAKSGVNTGAAVFRGAREIEQVLTYGWELQEPGLVSPDRWQGIGPARTLQAWEVHDQEEVFFVAAVAKRAEQLH